MFNFRKVSDLVIPLNSKTILERIDEYDIFRYYLGFNFNLRENYRSPLRGDDVTPSFSLYLNRNGELRFKDFGGTNQTGNCFQFVMDLYRVSFMEALEIINRDFKLGLGFNNTSLGSRPDFSQQKKKFRKKNNIIQIIPRKFSSLDYEYWRQFNIDKSILQKYQVYTADKVFINKRLWCVYRKDNPVYAYRFNNKLKIYRPYADKKQKFRTNTDQYDLQGINQLFDYPLLVITSSLKDVMTWYSYGYPAVAPQSENTFIPEKITDYLMAKYPNIVVNFDSDSPGVKASIELTQRLGCYYWNIPKEYEAKDVSDFRKAYGHEETKQLLSNLKIKKTWTEKSHTLS